MRYFFGVITVASALVLVSGESNAQVCKTQTVASGYSITGKDGYSYSCCQGHTGGGSCLMKSCKVGTSASSPPRYLYEKTFVSSNCSGPVVK